jgi:hypothetical protein
MHEIFPSFNPSLLPNASLLFTASSLIKWRRMRWAGHVARIGDNMTAYMLLVVKPEGKRSLGRPNHRWVDNIKMDLGEIGRGCVYWMGLAQGRNKWRAVVNAVMNLRVRSGAGKLSNGCTAGGPQEERSGPWRCWKEESNM